MVLADIASAVVFIGCAVVITYFLVDKLLDFIGTPH